MEAQEQGAASPPAGERLTFQALAGVVAARRVVGLLINLTEAKLVFDKESKAVIVTEVDHASGTWSEGDKVIDYDECQAIRELLDRAEDEWNNE